MTLAIGCQSCDAAMINGLFCHEIGCPDAWRDYSIRCRVCGFDFKRPAPYETVCDDCHEDSLFG